MKMVADDTSEIYVALYCRASQLLKSVHKKPMGPSVLACNISLVSSSKYGHEGHLGHMYHVTFRACSSEHLLGLSGAIADGTGQRAGLQPLCIIQLLQYSDVIMGSCFIQTLSGLADLYFLVLTPLKCSGTVCVLHGAPCKKIPHLGDELQQECLQVVATTPCSH